MTDTTPLAPLGVFENQTDIGREPVAGSGRYDADRQVYNLIGAGVPLGADPDGSHFIWRRMTGNFIITAQAQFTSLSTHPQAALGWMARASLQPGAPTVKAVIQGDGQVSLQLHRTGDGAVETIQTPLSRADVIQLERNGRTFILSAAQWGEPFTTVQAEEIDLDDEIFIGLFVASGDAEQLTQAVFKNVRVVVPVRPGFNRESDPFGSRLELLDVTSGDRQIIYSTNTVFEAPNWTRDGKALIFNSGGRLFHFDLDSQTPVLIDTGDVIRNNNDHVLSFDGRMLAVSSHTGDEYHSMIFTLPVQGGQPSQITPTGPSYLHGWSPDGKYLVYTGLRGGDYDIYRIPAAGGAEVQLTTAPGLDDGPEYTPDGQFIYFNSVRSGRMQIWRMLADGSRQEQVTDDEYNNWFPHISPDGQWVIFLSYLVGEVKPDDHPAAKRVYLRMMPLNGGAPKVVAYLYGGQGTMNVPSWSPDGKMVAFVSNTVPF